jgi:predicted SAM-dependent methyltransferase
MKKAINYIDISIYKCIPKQVNLGCGDCYKIGYINTDIKEDVVYNRKKEPDIYCDFTDIYFDNNSLDKILFSHTLEHFQRHEAIILLTRFNKWLKQNSGVLNIFVPDVNACILEYPNSTYARRKELIRHMWGSHEGFWAIHCEGYFNENLKELLEACGFFNITFKNYGG